MSLDARYFDELYDRRDDPWSLAERWYERRKRSLTMGILPKERYASALEIGCSVGVLTEQLAQRCDHLLATDIAQKPVSLTQQRLDSTEHRSDVDVRVMRAPAEWPQDRFDLVVLSEVGYYLDEGELALLGRQSASSLTPGGVVVACHWRHPVSDYPLRGDRVHEILIESSGLIPLGEYVDEDFRLAVLAPPGTPSVGTAEGLTS